MVFKQYDLWRSHPSITLRGIRDVRFVLPGFGSALVLFGIYLGVSSMIGGNDHHHGDAGHHEEAAHH